MDFDTTLIGSLPFDSEKEALDRTLDGRISCPSWPQLPAFGFSESMYVQTGERLPGVEIDEEGGRVTVDLSGYDPAGIYEAILTDDVDYFVHSRRNHRGLFELMGRDLRGFRAVKGQVTGPISQGLQVVDKEGRAAIYDESYSEIIRRTVNMTAKWQVRELRKKNGKVLMFFDEPSLTLLGSPFASVPSRDAAAWMDEAMDVPGCIRGVHCCGNADWPMVLGTDADIISFDAYGYARNIAMFPSELSGFLERGGILSWGIVPSTDDVIGRETAESIERMLASNMDLLIGKGIDREALVTQSMITPQCGLGGMTPENADRAFTMLRQVSDGMKGRYGLE